MKMIKFFCLVNIGKLNEKYSTSNSMAAILEKMSPSWR
jgi:hypothetical protein